MDSKEPKLDVLDTYLKAEGRYNIFMKSNPDYYAKTVEELKGFITRRYNKLKVFAENNL